MEPNPSEVSPWYLRNITQALELDGATGNVFVRTNAVLAGNVSVGNVAIGALGNVNISGNTLPVSVVGNIAGITSNVTVVDGGGSITVDGNVGISGNVNIGTMPNVNANVTGNVGITGTANVTVIGQNLDAFGRLRISEPFTLFDTNARYYDHQQFSTSTSGTANVVYNANSSTYTMNVGSSNGDSTIRESMRVFPYQPGKSLLILSTFAMATPKTNLRQRVGLFGSQNGIFFENDGTYNYMVIRSYSTGVLTEDRVRQDAWNGDRLDGLGGATNPSGITLYPERDQIFYTDVEWLGVGSVRTGFVINGAYYTCHTFNHANMPNRAGFDNTLTYMTTATLPLRYEITNTGATTGSSAMRQICSSVISEGGYNALGVTETAGTGINVLRLTTGGTYYPVVSIRMNSSRLDSIVLPTQVDILSPSVNYYRWVLLKNATLTGATWTGTSQTGSVDIDTGATSYTNGILLQSGFATARSTTELYTTGFFQFQLGRTLANVSDVVTLALTAISNNADVLAQLGWQELT